MRKINYVAKKVYLLTMTVILIVSESSDTVDRRFAIVIKENDRDIVFHGLQRLRCRMVYEITPESFIFEYLGQRKDVSSLIAQIKTKFGNEIVGIEKIMVYTNYILPEERNQTIDILSSEPGIESEQHYYGMGVTKAWAQEYTGKSVVVAVTDVGIHKDILDLKQNINDSLCYNFINNSGNVTPEVFHILPDIMFPETSHGDYCSGLIASVFGNGICTCGIAYNAKIAGYKIFEIMLVDDKFPVTRTGSDIISRALVHNLSEIDIYSNAWSPKDPFTTLDLPTEAAIRYGAEHGRGDLGAIYVFPSGQPGNQYSNNIYTIAVNGIGRDWSVPEDSGVSANVLTCGLAEGSNITAKYMKTVATGNICVTSFKGVSAATAQVSAKAALALEANPNLTLRGFQHLVVQASEPKQTGESGFSPNGAGLLYHSNFGFGLLNAEKLVTLAERGIQLLPRINRTITDTIRNVTSNEVVVNICYECDVLDDEKCLNVLEHVMVEIRLKSWNIPSRIILISPSGTESILLNYTTTDKKISYTKSWFTSVHFWNETALGNWRLEYTQLKDPFDGNEFHPVLTLFGTRQTMSSQSIRTTDCTKRTFDNGRTATSGSNPKTLSKGTFQKEMPVKTPKDTDTITENPLLKYPIVYLIVVFIVYLFLILIACFCSKFEI